MGKEISYCHSCGHRLLESEAARLHDHRRFCRSCCPPEAVPAAPRRQSSTRLRMAPGPAPKPRETTRVRKRRPIGMIVAGTVAAALAIGIALAAGGTPPPETPPAPSLPAPVEAKAEPKPPTAPALDELLSRIRELRQSDLMFDRRGEVLGLLKEAAGRSGPRVEEVDQLAADYDRKFEQAAARLADFTRSEAMRMAAKEKIAEAIERLDGYPEAFRTSKSAEQIRALRREFESRRAVPLPSPPQKQVVGRS